MLGRHEGDLEITGRPDIRRSQKGKLHSAGQHAYDGVRRGIKIDDLVDDAAVSAEPAVPECIGEHDHWFTGRLAVVPGKRPAQLRLDSQHVKEIGTDSSDRDLLRRSS